MNSPNQESPMQYPPRFELFKHPDINPPHGGMDLVVTSKWCQWADSMPLGHTEKFISKAEHEAIITTIRADERAKALEEAAKESELWWPLFDFDSFAKTDLRRLANPNHIAQRIRHLAQQGREPEGEKKCPPHSWDQSGERCTKCGDKDWMT
jgi:hypothetical protein